MIDAISDAVVVSPRRFDSKNRRHFYRIYKLFIGGIHRFDKKILSKKEFLLGIRYFNAYEEIMVS